MLPCCLALSFIFILKSTFKPGRLTNMIHSCLQLRIGPVRMAADMTISLALVVKDVIMANATVMILLDT